jgi:hypothetical protein
MVSLTLDQSIKLMKRHRWVNHVNVLGRAAIR